ncbi:hypothetical protein BDQ17DRAFT_657289 [Cyathus striatus]|nr:hypothetical protein BDQ17DRAFT_657289 [Cyathus striatus]
MESLVSPTPLYTIRPPPQETLQSSKQTVWSGNSPTSTLRRSDSPTRSSYSISIYSRESADELRLDISSNLGRRIISGVVAENTSHNVTPVPTPRAGNHTSLYLSTENVWSLPPPPRPARSPVLQEPDFPELQPLKRKRSVDDSNESVSLQPRNQPSDITDMNGRPLASAFAPNFTIVEESLPLPQLPKPSMGHRRSISVNVSKPISSPNEVARTRVWNRDTVMQQGIERATTYSYVVQQNRDFKKTFD